MDLVKIGFLIQANGLKDANKEVDSLLTRVDQIGTKSKKAAADFETGQKKVQGSAKDSERVVITAAEKMIKKQEALARFLQQPMDKQTAGLAASFSLVSDSAQDLNKYLGLLGQNKSFVQMKRETEALKKAQIAQIEAAEAARQKQFTGEQKYYQKQVEAAKAAEAQIKAAHLKTSQDIEAARQKRYSAEQTYYQKQMEQAKATQAAATAARNKAAQDEETARQKRFLAEQKYYQKQVEEARAAQKALEQSHAKTEKDMETARQRRFAAEQKYYQKQMEQARSSQNAEAAKAKAQLDAQQKIQQQYQKTIALEQAKAKYQGQGFTNTAATKLARMDVSGADVATMNAYKQSLIDAGGAMRQLGDQTGGAARQQGFFNTQIGGIIKYAVLSAAIYGVMSAMTQLAVSTVKMADEYTSIQNRMKLYITDANVLADVNKKLATYAMANNIGLRETATLFARLQPAMLKVGANTAAVTSVVDAFGKSMRIGGATATEAASATLQFSQAMASGKLAGDEFRSISEASPRFLKAIADGSGIAAEKLKAMSSAGMLTTEVISKALLKEYPKLIEENKKLGVSLEQGANALKTGFLVAIGEFNEGAEITKNLGNAFMGLAQSLFASADGARESGKGLREWFAQQAGIISAVTKAVEFLAIAYASKLVAGFIIARIEAIRYQAALVSMAAAQAGVTRSSIIMGSAMTAAGNAAKGALIAVGGWSGLLLTVIGVAAAYLLMSSNAEEANKKLVEQSEWASKTKAELQALNKEQRDNAKFKMNVDVEEANANLNNVRNTYVSLIQVMANSSLKGKLSTEVQEIAKAVNEGSMSFDTATRKLTELGVVSDKESKKLSEQSKMYNQAAAEALKLSDSAKLLGVNFALGGNAAQNATPAIANLKTETKGLGEEALIAGSKFNKMATDLKKAAAESRSTLAIMKQYNLEESFARKLVEGAATAAAPSQGRIDSALEQIKTAEAMLSKLGKNDPLRKTLEGSLARSKDFVALQQKALDLNKQVTVKGLVPDAKEAQNAATAISDYTTSLKDAQKEQDKLDKKAEKYSDRLEDQINYVGRLQNLLAKGVDYETAKIAAEKEYAATIQGTALASDVVAAKQLQEQMDYIHSLGVEEDLQNRIIQLMKLGASYAIAREVASAHLGGSLKGQEMATVSMTNALGTQNQQLVDQVNTQKVLNDYLAQGLSLEEATLKVTMARLARLQGGKLTPVQTSLEDNISKDLKSLEIAQAAAAARLSITESTRQAKIYQQLLNEGVTQYGLALAKINADNKGISEEDAKKKLAADQELAFLQQKTTVQGEINTLLSGEDAVLRGLRTNFPAIEEDELSRLYHNQKLVKVLSEQADAMEAMKNTPLGDFSSISFEAFGDFGNPFKDALDGANNLMASLNTLAEGLARIREEQKNLNEALSKEDAGTAQYKTMTTKLAAYSKAEKLSIKQAKDAKIAFVGTAISGAKSLFKEESKGYKLISHLEQAYQAGVIAFKLWEKKDEIQMVALKLAGYAKEGIAFVTSAATKIAAQMGVNVAKGTEAVLTQASGDPYTAFGRMAAMAAVVAGLGIAIGGISGGSSSEEAPKSNQGTGTVFGGALDDKSESIVNAMELLADNSDLGLPISAAMLRSLQNIENSIGGVANLIIRGNVGAAAAMGGDTEARLTGTTALIEKIYSPITSAIAKWTDKLTGLGLGSMIDGVVNKVLGGLFGKTSTSVTAQGLAGSQQSLGSIMSGGMKLSEYADIQTTKKSWFSKKTSYSTNYTDANADLKNQFKLVFTNIYDSVLSASDILGGDLSKVSSKLKNYIVDIGKIDIRGLSGEDIQAKLEAVFGAEADKIAAFAFSGLDAFQQIGEGYYETLVRVATGTEEASYYADRLGVKVLDYSKIMYKQGDVAAELLRQSILAAEGTKRVAGGFYDLVGSFNGTAEEITGFVISLREMQEAIYVTGKSGDYLTSAMILGAGGTEELVNGLETYFDMLSTADQAKELTRRMTADFKLLGAALPSNVEAFKTLVKGIDVTTASGQKLYGQVLALAPEFMELQDALQDAKDEAAATADSITKANEDAAAAAAKLAEEAAKLAEEAQKAAAELAALIKEATKYTDSLRITAVNYAQVANKTGNAATEILRASMLAYLGSAKLAGGFYTLVGSFEGTASELFNFIVKMRDVQEAIFVTGQSSKNITQAMLKGSDGIDALSTGLDAFFGTLSTSQKATELTRRMTSDFAALGLTLPANIEAFRQMAMGINTNTAAGQELFGRLITLTPEFVTLQEALKQVADENKAAADEVQRLADEAKRVAEEAAQAAEEARKLAEEFALMMKGLQTAIIITGQTAGKVNQAMIDGAGGSDALLSGLEAIFEMLSPAEKAAELTRRLSEQFAALGVALPADVKAFRALVKGMDTATDAGKTLFGQVVALAPEFTELQSALDGANTDVNQLVQSLRDLAAEAAKAAAQTDQPQNLRDVRSLFNSEAYLASKGDSVAAENLVTLGRDLMELSKQYSVSGQEYARDLAMIQTAATAGANTQEAGLGYTPPTLTPAVGANTNVVVETTNSATDAKLEALRSDLMIAITAVAKYTQDTAIRLERWDYGDRMNVHVEQDALDVPLKVKTV